MRKGNIKIYNFNTKGKYVLAEEIDYDKYISDNSLKNDESFNELLDKELYKNPFLFNLNIDYKIDLSVSVESFYIKHNSKDCTFESLIRSDYYSTREKKKIINKIIKEWGLEINNKIDETLINNKELVKKANKYEFKTLSFTHKFLLLLGLILPLLVLYNVISFINTNHIIYKIFGICLIVLALFGYILGFMQSRIERNFRNSVDKHCRLVKVNSKKLQQKFKKNKRLLKKYYNSGYIHDQFMKEPLSIDEVQIGGNKLIEIEESMEKLKANYQAILDNTNKPNLNYKIAVLLSYFLPLFSGGFIIIMLLIHIFKLIFMKGE